MRDLVERERSYGRAMLADLTARPALEGPASPLAEPVDGQDGSGATSAYPKTIPDVLAASWRNVVADVVGTYDAAMRVMREAGPMLLGEPSPRLGMYWRANPVRGKQVPNT